MSNANHRGAAALLTRRRAFLLASAVVAAPALLRGFPAEAAAPALGPSPQTFQRFRLGGFEITSLLDASAMIDGPWPIVGEDRSAAEVEQLMQANLLPEKRFRPGFSPLLVNTGRELILFDAGNGAEGFVPPPAGGRLVKSLAVAGYTPEQVDVVVLTHAHPDHIGGLLTDGKPTFQNARYVIGAKEFDFWKTDAPLKAPRESNEYRTAVMFRSYLQPLAEKARFLDPDGEVAPGIRAVKAYGHTPGHLAFHVESEGKRLLIWGDCAHHEVASLGARNGMPCSTRTKKLASPRAGIFTTWPRPRSWQWPAITPLSPRSALSSGAARVTVGYLSATSSISSPSDFNPPTSARRNLHAAGRCMVHS